jgi:ribosomal protein S3
VTVIKLTTEELARYRQLRAKRLGKSTEPSAITVDVQQRRNMQGMIPVQLWADVRAKAAQDMIPVRRMLEIALETYLVMEPEDFQRIKERYTKLEEEMKESG